MKRNFTSKRLSDIFHVNTGTGSKVVDITFVPDFFRARFYDIAHKDVSDVVSFSLTSTGDPTSPYQMTVSWDVKQPRDIKYIAAELPVDPEQTISF